ncbi:hypothetical protein D910_03294 [Dendroctonus ponderosae]|uniref:Uncharacterized protein n=1 Tax=Dendroctonus ponderosae TaxID=77166 RepID=U4TWE7_DENPD|nr:hypothetical protein D910_03294 [Dendroctonus ponderosae]
MNKSYVVDIMKYEHFNAARKTSYWGVEIFQRVIYLVNLKKSELKLFLHGAQEFDGVSQCIEEI